MNDWQACRPDCRWVLDKLLLSDRLGYRCGPSGTPVPEPGLYVVRPVVNIDGMGIGASLVWIIDDSAEDVEPGYFWCEQLEGEHISVDYEYGKPGLTVEGTRQSAPFIYGKSRLDRWNRWEVTDKAPPNPPEFVQEILDQHEIANCEYVGGNLIEVQFHENPDFQWGNTVAIPVYRDMEVASLGATGFRYEPCPDGDRLGFLIE